MIQANSRRRSFPVLSTVLIVTLFTLVPIPLSGYIPILFYLFYQYILSGRLSTYHLVFLALLPLSLLSSQPYLFLQSYLFFFGFLLFYPFCLMSNYYLSPHKVLRFLCFFSFIYTLVEFSLLNSPFSHLVFYIPHDHPHLSLVYGFYKSLGITHIASTSGFLASSVLFLDILISRSISRFILFFSFLTIILLVSGSGFFLMILALLFYYCTRLKPRITWQLLIWTPATILLFAFLILSFQKFSFDYIVFIFDFKSEQISSFSSSSFGTIFGNILFSDKTILSSDFGYISILFTFGLLGLFSYLLSAYILSGKSIHFLALVLLSLFHYPAFTGPVGSLFLALFCSILRYRLETSSLNHATSASNS